MANADVNYSAITNEGNPFIQQQQINIEDDHDAELGSDNDELGQNSGIMIHVVPDTSKSKQGFYYETNITSFFLKLLST